MKEGTLQNDLKDKREKADLTQEELAAEVGVSRQTINTIENHFCDPSTSLALQIATVLNCSVEEIFKLDKSV